jgi:methylthioribulose-1-phosphate dehydratase
MTDFVSAAAVIVAAGARFDQRGWAPATAGNYSVRLDDGSIAITVSGAHKGRLTPDLVMRVDREGRALDTKRPSAETLLHCLIYDIDPAARAVVHTHSVAGTVLSRALQGASAIDLAGYEVLKALPGIDTHDTTLALPLVENTQDMPALAAELRPLLLGQSPQTGTFYIRGHGLYAWGADLAAAESGAEAIEFLLACAWEEWKAK